ncbi:MAG: CsgG/HfaB family protein [Campylobacterota bacterium]|nr:CsgG/HfaB family protein [Campylobacterota bacterium]
MLSLKIFSSLFIALFWLSGCSKEVNIRAISPAEVGEMSSKKKIAISSFKNDKYGLSSQIEAQIAKHKLDEKRYFSVVSRKDLKKVLEEQRLQSSELMDESTASRVGKLIGAQAIINGEVGSSSARMDKYLDNRIRCLKYVKNKGCIKYQTYYVTCRTIQASVSANINIVNVQTGLLIYGDSITKEYNGDSCRGRILSSTQALNRLTSSVASEFVYKLTPHYIYFDVRLLDEIELDDVSDEQEERFENALAYIEAGRMDKAKKLLRGLLDDLDGESFVVAYVLGVVYEAQADYIEAKKLYMMADDLVSRPVDEINLALVRIERLIIQREEAREQIDAK